MQRKIPTLIGVIIIVVVAAVLFGGVFTYQHFALKTIPTTPSNLIQKQQDRAVTALETEYKRIDELFNKAQKAEKSSEINTLVATPASGTTPLEVTFYGRFSVNINDGFLYLDYGEPQFNGNSPYRYCPITNDLIKTNDGYIMNIYPYIYSYKSPGTYIAEIRLGEDCTAPAFCCKTLGKVISSFAITVK